MSMATNLRSRVVAANGWIVPCSSGAGHAGNGDDCKKRHLQAGVEEAARAHTIRHNAANPWYSAGCARGKAAAPADRA